MLVGIPIVMGWILVWNLFLTKYKFLQDFKVFVYEQVCRMFCPSRFRNSIPSHTKPRVPQLFTLYRSGELPNKKYRAYLDLMKVKKLIHIRNAKRAKAKEESLLQQPIMPDNTPLLPRVTIPNKVSIVLHSAYFAQPSTRIDPKEHRRLNVNTRLESWKVDDSYM